MKQRVGFLVTAVAIGLSVLVPREASADPITVYTYTGNLFTVCY